VLPYAPGGDQYKKRSTLPNLFSVIFLHTKLNSYHQIIPSLF
jgi:hypothetical protein